MGLLLSIIHSYGQVKSSWGDNTVSLHLCFCLSCGVGLPEAWINQIIMGNGDTMAHSSDIMALMFDWQETLWENVECVMGQHDVNHKTDIFSLVDYVFVLVLCIVSFCLMNKTIWNSFHFE